MRRIHPLVLAMAALVTLAATACGIEAGDQASGITTTSSTTSTTSGASGGLTAPSTTEDGGATTAPTTPRSPQDKAVIAQMSSVYQDMGLSPTESDCLAGGVYDMMQTGGDMADTSAIMDIVNECDIPMSKLAQIGSGTDGTLEGGVKKGIIVSLEHAGLTQAQATCVADAYVEKFGTEIAPSRNANQMRPLLRGCGVTTNPVLGN